MWSVEGFLVHLPTNTVLRSGIGSPSSFGYRSQNEVALVSKLQATNYCRGRGGEAQWVLDSN